MLVGLPLAFSARKEIQKAQRHNDCADLILGTIMLERTSQTSFRQVSFAPCAQDPWDVRVDSCSNNSGSLRIHGTVHSTNSGAVTNLLVGIEQDAGSTWRLAPSIPVTIKSERFFFDVRSHKQVSMCLIVQVNDSMFLGRTFTY